MPEIDLKIPENSLYHCSLNEIDMCMGEIFLREMRIADPRNKLRKQDILANPDKNDWLWDKSRIFQLDDLEIEDIFDTYLLRKKINNENNVDVSYPILCYKENDIETVFWGTGNRRGQWYFNLENTAATWTVGSTVGILDPIKYRGLVAKIHSVEKTDKGIYFTLSIKDKVIQERKKNLKYVDVLFNTSQLKLLDEKLVKRFKAKAITGTYESLILVDNRDEAQYIRDKFMLRCADGEIWHKFKSPTIDYSENQIFTVFGIPNLKKFPASKDKIKGEGYIYGVGFTTNIWSCITDEPLPSNYIDTIRMNLHVEREGLVNRIVIN